MEGLIPTGLPRLVYQLACLPSLHCSGQRPCLAGPFTKGRLNTESPNVRKTYTGGEMLEDTMTVIKEKLPELVLLNKRNPGICLVLEFIREGLLPTVLPGLLLQ